MMRRAGWLLALLACSLTAAASAPLLLAQGARDGSAPAWAIAAATPAGWTRDCCVYARAIGVDAVLYRGEWTGKPQRVMVLNVWPSKLPTMAAEMQAAHKRYLHLDPAGKVSSFAVRHPVMACEATVYQGGDHIDDMLVFCDPGKASGVRLSWSMTINADDPTRRALLDDFMQVVMATRYQRQVAASAMSAPAPRG